MTSTWSPSSYQLQFNFKLRKAPTPLLFARTRISSFDHGRRVLRVRCVAQDGAKSEVGSQSEEGRANNSWSGSSNSSAAMDDWFGNANSEQTGDSQHKGIRGLLGVGLASFFLVAGITFAGMSIGKRNSSRPKQEVVPLLEQQEMLSTQEEEIYRQGEIKNDGESDVLGERNLQNDDYQESKIGMDSDLASSLDSTENVSQKTPVDYPELESLSEREEPTGNASIRGNLQSDTTVNDVNSPDTISTSSEFPQPDIRAGGDVTSSFIDSESTLVESEREVDVEVVVLINSDTDVENLGVPDTVEQRGMFAETLEDALDAEVEPSSSSYFSASTDSQGPNGSANSKLDTTLETENVPKVDIGVAASISQKEDAEIDSPLQFSSDSNSTPVGINDLQQDEPSVVASSVAQSSSDKQHAADDSKISGSGSVLESESPIDVSTRGIPAPILLSAALQVPPGKILVPAVTDQAQGQALSALQVLKVIDSAGQPGQLCSRREYARWLVSASSALSRNSISKVYPAMYIENFTELAFDDVTPVDPDFTSIQGLAEAGLISSKLSKRDMLSSPDEDIGSFYFHPDSPLSRQDLVTWKMALEKRRLPEADRKTLQQLSGFIDVDKIDPDAWPALVADLSAGEQGIVPLAFGYTRLFQPDKPVTKGQAAIALATGEAADIVSEELARIEAESIADKAVAAHNALVAEVEKDINASFEKELSMEREKIDVVQKMAEEASKEVERLRKEREEQNLALMKERAAIESEMEVLSKLRRELEEQLQSLLSNKVEISYEKERIEKLRKETEEENQAIARLQYELEVERKALSMARAWAEEEAKRVQEHAKALEEARLRWERQGIKVVVGEDLREEELPENTWANVGKQLSIEETVDRAENLTDKLKVMADQVVGKSKEIINKLIEKIKLLISAMKQWISDAGKRTIEFRHVAIAKVGGSLQELQQHAADLGSIAKEQAERVVKRVSGN